MAFSPNYSRIDGALAAACEETPQDEKSLTVFVHTKTPPDVSQSSLLSEYGVRQPTRPTRIFTAELSPVQIAALSHQEWITQIRLSQRLKMTDE